MNMNKICWGNIHFWFENHVGMDMWCESISTPRGCYDNVWWRGDWGTGCGPFSSCLAFPVSSL